MGRKGGGRAGFFKAARGPADSDEDEGPIKEQQAAPAAAVKPTSKSTDAAATKPEEKPVISKKAAAFLATSGGDDSSDEDAAADQGGRTKEGETRGQMVQRHKRESKAVKDQVKRLGKKGKDEAAKLVAGMETRHKDELSQLIATTTTTVATEDAKEAGDGGKDVDEVTEGINEASLGGKKQTKAQKRREQKLREELERDARIAAEVAELGETERVAEERELQLLLKPLGLEVKDIPPDGHCLYRSLEDQLLALPDAGATALATVAAAAAAAAAGSENEEEEEATDELNFLALRKLAAEHMRANRDHFKDFVIESDTADGNVADGDDAFDAYCTEISSTAAWGGHVEIQALCQALKMHVQVLSVGMPVLEIGEEFKEQGPSLKVCYLRHAFGLGEHYNSVQAASPSGDEEE